MEGKGADLFFEDSNQKTKPQTPNKKKVTFYLYPSVAEKLDEVWLALKSQNNQVTKSKIAEIGITQILKEFEEEAQQSALSKYFLG